MNSSIGGKLESKDMKENTWERPAIETMIRSKVKLGGCTIAAWGLSAYLSPWGLFTENPLARNTGGKWLSGYQINHPKAFSKNSLNEQLEMEDENMGGAEHWLPRHDSDLNQWMFN